MASLCNDHTAPFPCSFEEILQRIRFIKPVKYGATRNYLNGAVTHLSPYISRGVVSTKFVLQEVLKKGHSPESIEKFIQELAWRDYWQQVWISKGTAINTDLKHLQAPITNSAISNAIIEGATGIHAIDNAIKAFYQTGYLHNHLRMYIASMACNIAQSHWNIPAKWMYYHLLDADWASNALSWQWVAGSNSNKKYYANQQNINKYCLSQQKHTFIDIPYEAFNTLKIPEVLKNTSIPNLETPLPKQQILTVDESLPICIYNFYNLDLLWKKDLKANRILLLEPSHFQEYPVSKKTIDFIIGLSENIPNIQVYVGSFYQLKTAHPLCEIYYKEHPLNQHYIGIEESRDWMFDVQGYFPSFFGFWKKCKKQLVY